MDNDLPEDDKTILGDGASGAAEPTPTAPPLPEDDDPFAVATPVDPVDLTAPPVSVPDDIAAPVDEVMDTPAAAAEEMPEAVDPEAEPPAPEAAPVDATAPPAPVDPDRTVIATPVPTGEPVPVDTGTSEPDMPVEVTAPPPVTAPPMVTDAPVAEPATEVPTEAPIEPTTGTGVEPAAETPAAAPLPTPTPINPNDPVPVGTMINNNYEIKELISAGGMGEVFRGANAFTGDAVAIKIVLQSLANDPKIAALFMREAKVLCGLSDQAIVRYYNFVRDADLDRFCLIMEFIDGVSLSDYTRDERPLTSPEARDLLRKVARGLDRAHKMDVVHRDLSPDNVMLRDGDVSTPVLIDFGIAKSTEMAENTLHGQLAGKFKYISPEQLGHFGGHIGPRTDIYGLGLLIAAALRGEPLDMGSSVVEAVNARSKIPDLDGIPEDMQPILSHMLEPNPDDRPDHMVDVIRILDDPGALPAKYGATADWDVEAAEPDRTVLAQSPVQTPAQTQQPQGLRQPPGASTNTGLGATMGGHSIVPGQGGDGTSASPFGAASVAPGQLAGGTQAPVTGIPGLSTPPQSSQPTMAPTSSTRRRKRRGDSSGFGGFLRWVAILAVIGGLGGFVAYQQGYLPEELTGIAPPERAAGGTTEATPETPTTRLTRRSFLADFEAGECAYADRVAAGPNSGTIETFSDTPDSYAGLQDAYEGKFNTRPSVKERIISTEQCAALGLARSMQTSDAVPPVLVLDTDSMASGGAIVGRLRDRRARPVWLILVTTAGGVYNLTDRLSEQADGSATFSFGLNASGAGGAEPQMIMVIATDQPLIAAGAATNGARASSLLPQVEDEIRDLDRAAAASVSYFDLMP